MAEILSDTGTYLPVADFLNRCDNALVAQLVTQTNVTTNPVTPISPYPLNTNPSVLARLGDASGMLETACVVKSRYLPADLRLIANTDCNTRSFMYSLLTDITMSLLYKFRVNRERSPGLELQSDEAMKWLMALAEGERIFGLVEVAADGIEDHKDITFQNAINADMTTVRAGRYFGSRYYPINSTGWGN